MKKDKDTEKVYQLSERLNLVVRLLISISRRRLLLLIGFVFLGLLLYTLLPTFVGKGILITLGLYFLFLVITVLEPIIFGIKAAISEESEVGMSEKKPSQSEKNHKISISYPKSLTKRFESTFLFQVYLPDYRVQAKRNIKSEFQDIRTTEHTERTSMQLSTNTKVL